MSILCLLVTHKKRGNILETDDMVEAEVIMVAWDI